MKTAWKLCLALALMVAALFVVSVPAFAAGTHTVSGTYKIEGVDTTGAKFKLYKVGGFGRDEESGKSFLILDPAITSNVPADITIDVNIEKGDKSETDWQNAWLKQAALVEKYLPDSVQQIGEDAVTDNDGKFSFSETVVDGLYLVISKDDPQKQYMDDGTTVIWKPQAMFVLVLNNDPVITIKPISRTIKPIRVYKSWEGGHESLRPQTIRVQLTYNGQDEGEPVTLEEKDGILQYTWKNLEKEGVYDVKEIMSDEMKENFSVSYVYTDEEKVYTINITNKYDRYKLKLLKKMPAFTVNGEQATTTFVFEVKGYDEAEGGKEIYSTRVGLQVNEGEVQKEIEVPDIPRTVKRITVQEIYSGGYKPSPEDPQTVLLGVEEGDDNEYSVEFTNNYNAPYYTGGVINRFTRKFGENNKPTYDWEAIGSIFQSKD